MTASDYPVGFGYGATDDTYYYTPTPSHPKNPLWIGNYHRGNDFFTPTGTDVVVGGVLIGKTGATGAVSGPHIHVQLSPEANPTGKEWNYQGAVIETGQTSVEGKYIKIQGSDGIVRMYFHLSQILVSKGQPVGNMPYTDEQYNALKAKCEGYAEDWARQRYVLGGRDPASITQEERRLRLDMTVQEAGTDLDRDLPLVPSPYELMKDATPLAPGKYLVK